MPQGIEHFDMEYRGEMLQVQKHSLGGQTIFRIAFPDRRRPLIITRASDPNGSRWWTSIPEGRQQEAEEFGALVSQYYKSGK